MLETGSKGYFVSLHVLTMWLRKYTSSEYILVEEFYGKKSPTIKNFIAVAIFLNVCFLM